MFQNITGLLKRHRADGSHVWHIDKRVRRYGRLCESMGTSDREEAERYLFIACANFARSESTANGRNVPFEMLFRNTWPRTRRRSQSIEMRRP